jgi:hypothetical protein
MEWWNSLDPNITAAIISVGITSITLFIGGRIKRHNEKKLHIEKLIDEHRHDEQKKIKESISKNKIQLINAAEILNHRLLNFAGNWEKKWHHSDTDVGENSYYSVSFAYRLLKFYWWVLKADNELVYLDTTLADKSDMDFIKFLRIFPGVMCQVTLFDGLDYDAEYDTDHFFKHDFENIIASFEVKKEFPEYQTFKEVYSGKDDEISSLISFIDGMSADEKRLRWTRLFSLHLLVISFLNAYGYSFQYTGSTKIKAIAQSLRLHLNGSTVLDNFNVMLAEIQLDKNEHVQNIKIVTKAKNT